MDCAVESLTLGDATGQARLRDVSTVAAAGQLLAVVGPPGPEKVAFLRAVTGSLPPEWTLTGRICLGDEELTGQPTVEWRQRGIFFAPVSNRPVDLKQSVRVSLTARAKLGQVPDRALDGWLDRLLDYFPRLAPRADVVAANLSHGEQAILALALQITTRPRVVAIEHPSNGVSPLGLIEIFSGLRRYARDHQAIAICSEENTVALLREADQILLLHQGRAVFNGTPEELKGDLEALRRLGLTAQRVRYGRSSRPMSRLGDEKS
ncbi:MAG TPA: ATP-binding cassette domain-containing protein [Dehalococcoidia bacterium]|nr:ATP-binding cassette domain-containing protein [Dehalococcoidia bacterium]